MCNGIFQIDMIISSRNICQWPISCFPVVDLEYTVLSLFHTVFLDNHFCSYDVRAIYMLITTNFFLISSLDVSFEY